MVISTGMPVAVACMEGEGIRGTVKFYPIPRGTLLMAEICGLQENGTGFYGFHIHEGETCAGPGFSGSGGHWNPGKGRHPDHPGDLPSLLSMEGRAFLAVKTGRFTPWEVLGKTVVIHGQPEDFRTQPGGNAGEKIACGVIRRL